MSISAVESYDAEKWHAVAAAVKPEVRLFIDGDYVDGIEEAVAVANDSIYGLAAVVWTSNLNTAHRLIRDLEAGVIWVNCFDEGDMTQPFGGMKQSGNAKDKCFESLLSYTETKSAWIRHG